MKYLLFFQHIGNILTIYKYVFCNPPPNAGMAKWRQDVSILIHFGLATFNHGTNAAVKGEPLAVLCTLDSALAHDCFCNQAEMNASEYQRIRILRGSGFFCWAPIYPSLCWAYFVNSCFAPPSGWVYMKKLFCLHHAPWWRAGSFCSICPNPLIS